jgi:hypothetical protein
LIFFFFRPHATEGTAMITCDCEPFAHHNCPTAAATARTEAAARVVAMHGLTFQRPVHALEAWPAGEPITRCCLRLVTARPGRAS